MPYILQSRRKELELHSEKLAATPGELNFQFTRIAIQYFKAAEAGNYQAINDILGAFEGAKSEFYRRIAAPYENEKCMDNGDVY